jgi:hypothetical protein
LLFLVLFLDLGVQNRLGHELELRLLSFMARRPIGLGSWQARDRPSHASPIGLWRYVLERQHRVEGWRVRPTGTIVRVVLALVWNRWI